MGHEIKKLCEINFEKVNFCGAFFMQENNLSLSSFQIIQQFYPGQSRLSLLSLAKLLDFADQSIRNSISAGKFPIKSYKDGAHRFFDIRDVAAYLEKMRDGVIQKPVSKAKRGRPTKGLSMARATTRAAGGAA